MKRTRAVVSAFVSAAAAAAVIGTAAPAHAAATAGVVMNGSQLRMTGSDLSDDIEFRAEGNAVVVVSRVANIFNGIGSGCERVDDFKVRCPGASARTNRPRARTEPKSSAAEPGADRGPGPAACSRQPTSVDGREEVRALRDRRQQQPRPLAGGLRQSARATIVSPPPLRPLLAMVRP